MKLFWLGLLLPLIFSSCGEEVLTQNSLNSGFKSNDLQSFELNTCTQMTFEKPPVDILYVVDNSGSTLASSFQAIKGQIANTIYTISKDFDYHIYFAPLLANAEDSIQGYPLMVSNPSSLPSVASVNITNPENLSMFAQATGSNSELGFTRVHNLIDYNRSNGIFRDNANTIVVLISNGDDTGNLTTGFNGNTIPDEQKYQDLKNKFLKYTSLYNQSNTVSNPLNAQSFRFISLVAHSTCNSWKVGTNYIRMSKDIYEYQGFTDNPSKDSVDLCSQNYQNLFSVVNNSIKAVVVGHKYDYWKISSASESSIQTNDIQVTKITATGATESIPASATNGFEYLGYKTNQNTRYEPTVGEPVTGLVIKLNGTARVQYPECIIAKTRTPTEYFGYFSIASEPDISTIKVEIDGKVYPNSTTNGWSYLGWRDVLNIKVPGPTNAAVTPELNKSGFFIQLHGEAIFTNGQTINVFYKPKPK